ncbi:hypothetical protein HO133_002480 [Letharia lupina]|uniref:Azaphilone pigments biosynthesis cluster protein L N-terminal domain-containing protein n=1 Tax=Letharia lupina TaxID=560253 RepID=A0A8H6CC24_9LECA|nr:uncharacterized protein HO133_002480 [Letharia lupina]KAF6220800.1 hypothetical protein HO133_002480 [Letharia lupina]
MEPLSVGASVIAVVGATAKVIKGIRRLKALQDAPRELDDLLAEISQLELVLQAVQRAHENPGVELGRLLEMARRILVDFESLIEYKLTEAGTSNKVDRWQWTRSSKDVERLRGQLRDVTANLVALVGVNTSSLESITLDQVSRVTNQTLSEHRQLSNQILPILPALAHLVQLLEESPSTQSALAGSLGTVRQLTLESDPQANDTVAKATETETLQADQTVSKLHPQRILRVRKVQRWAALQFDAETMFCISNYSDFCHDPWSVTAEAESLVWRLFVLVARYPTRNYGDGPYRLLTEILPAVEWECNVESQKFTMLHQIVCGLSNLSLNAELRRSAAINELDRHGRSALWYAVNHRKLDYVRRLLERGADPNTGDPPIWAAVEGYSDYAIVELLLDSGATLSPSGDTGWLPWPYSGWRSDTLAVDELLVRHGIDLDHRAEFDGVQGVTILMRLTCDYLLSDAAPRLRQLIKFGADIEIADKRGNTAIMYAACAAFPETFDILARAGARLDVKTVTGSTILHLAVTHTSDDRRNFHRLCEVMRHADITKLDLEAQDKDGNTAFDLLRMKNGPNWEAYCQSKGLNVRLMEYYEDELEFELETISALEELLRHIQEVQGVPEADRYPPLGEYCARVVEDEPVPGAWPVY